MKKIRIKGKSVDDAVEDGLKILGLSKEDTSILVLFEGRPGVLGVFGGEDAEVEIKQKMTCGEDAKEILQEIINRLELMAVCDVLTEGDRFVNLEIKGEDLGKIIGKEGAMLQALQILVSSMVGRDFNERIRVNIDAGGYKSKQDQALCRLAKEAASDVAQSGVEKVLPPMSSKDRRVIHEFLQSDSGVQTFSRGEGSDRRLVIAPKTQE